MSPEETMLVRVYGRGGLLWGEPGRGLLGRGLASVQLPAVR